MADSASGNSYRDRNIVNKRKEFGDFQTPRKLATKVTALVADIYGNPDLVVEPTAGIGAFLNASKAQWGKACQYEGYEINRDYVAQSSKTLKTCGVNIFNRDFFALDWKQVLNRTTSGKVLVIGNPPWVTNSELGILGSQNRPKRSNFQRLRGLDARMGKSNFDIAEWMLIQLIEAIPPNGAVAMLCKTMTARKVLRHFWKTDRGRKGSCLFRIDAKASFSAAVDACLLFITGVRTDERVATIYDGLCLKSSTSQFGFIDGDLVSDISSYKKFREFGSGSFAYTWRSGIKHDAAKVMEFTREGGLYRNGLGETVELEDRYLYPLLKSSDLGNGRTVPRKSVLVPQQHIGDDTSIIEGKAPKTWQYLIGHAATLDGRKSSIYKNRPRFSIFGIGRYSFALWKVATSGLYKSFSFAVVPPLANRPVMVDDTCYSIPCDTESEARLLCDLLSSDPALAFLRSLVFVDAKRPITIDVLRRISFVSVAQRLGRLEELEQFIHAEKPNFAAERQLTLLMEPKLDYPVCAYPK